MKLNRLKMCNLKQMINVVHSYSNLLSAAGHGAISQSGKQTAVNHQKPFSKSAPDLHEQYPSHWAASLITGIKLLYPTLNCLTLRHGRCGFPVTTMWVSGHTGFGCQFYVAEGKKKNTWRVGWKNNKAVRFLACCRALRNSKPHMATGRSHLRLPGGSISTPRVSSLLPELKKIRGQKKTSSMELFGLEMCIQ